MMSMKSIALCIGLFAVIVGWVTYDPEIRTAAIPIIAGMAVVILALFGLIPEFVVCKRCGRKSLGTTEVCRHCDNKEFN